MFIAKSLEIQKSTEKQEESDAVVRGWVISFLDSHFLAACPWNCT